jgi:DNA-binding phage protein
MTFFGLKREAILLDSWLYIAKAMCAISVGFILGRTFAITRLDMISVLLGVMYNLEPINVLGLKGGINQLLASTLGALITGFLVYIMGYQVTFLTVALGIGLTLYVALKIDYRMVSPVAIFTSIYMTQLIQTNNLGLPSVLYTFRLRIVALGLGVLIALVFNFLFSLFYYQKIGRKRVEFVKLQAVNAIKHTIHGLKDHALSSNSEFILASVFNDVDMVKANLETMMKENSIPFNRKEKAKLSDLLKVVMHIKNITHCAYDCLFITTGLNETISNEDLDIINDVLNVFETIDFTNIKKSNFKFHQVNEIDNSRIHQNVKLMKNECESILKIFNGLN